MALPPYRILVVDDLKDWRTTLRGLLEDEGYKVEVAESQKKALLALEAQEFDLAVIDIRLVEKEEGNTAGLDLAERIKQRWSDVKVVIITGYDTPDTVKRALVPNDQGVRIAEEYALKDPASIKNLPLIIRTILERTKTP